MHALEKGLLSSHQVIYVLPLASSVAHVSKPSDFVASVSSSYPIMLVALQLSLGSSRKWKGSCSL